MQELLIRNIKTLWQTDDGKRKNVRGKDMAVIPHIDNAWILIERGIIRQFGSMENCPERADVIVDAEGKHLLPAWCDSHTHLVFAATREEEFVMRIRGKTYADIAAAGGGIINSAKKLRAMDETALLDLAMERLEEIRETGTGAVEIKSGYGLEKEAEYKILRVIRSLREKSPLLIRATFLGAHAMPPEFQHNRDAYIRMLTGEMIPKIAAESLADFCDVFCEEGYFSLSETEQILEAAARYGLRPKIHVNQFTNTGAVQLAVRHHALTVDHLEEIGDAEINCLLRSETLPAVLPSCSFFLGIPYAPARKLIDAGLPLVIASDFNPGSSPSGNVPFLISLACIRMGLLPEEAVNALTLNGAAAMDLADEAGSVAVGKRANLLLTKRMDSLAMIPYAFGSRLIEKNFTGA